MVPIAAEKSKTNIWRFYLGKTFFRKKKKLYSSRCEWRSTEKMPTEKRLLFSVLRIIMYKGQTSMEYDDD